MVFLGDGVSPVRVEREPGLLASKVTPRQMHFLFGDGVLDDLLHPFHAASAESVAIVLEHLDDLDELVLDLLRGIVVGCTSVGLVQRHVGVFRTLLKSTATAAATIPRFLLETALPTTRAPGAITATLTALVVLVVLVVAVVLITAAAITVLPGLITALVVLITALAIARVPILTAVLTLPLVAAGVRELIVSELMGRECRAVHRLSFLRVFCCQLSTDLRSMTAAERLESCIIFRLSVKMPELTSPRGMVTPFL